MQVFSERTGPSGVGLGSAPASIFSQAVLVVVGAVVLALSVNPPMVLRLFLMKQDLPVMCLCVGLMFLAHRWQCAEAQLAGLRPRLSQYSLGAAALAFIVFGAIGHSVIMHGYALSRDEQMAVFDAQIFATGSLIADIPPAWREYVEALGRLFILVSADQSSWVSGYLPVNAMLHAILIDHGAAALINPLLAAVGLIATWIVARQVWPDSQEPAAVAVLLYMTSVQVWAASMTAYAMTAHLALNMTWLALFLRSDRLGHAGAIVVGFVATGLHQLLFHPLFAVSFVLLLAARRQWWTFLAYVIAYLAIGLFWAMFTKFTIYAQAGEAIHELGGVSRYIERALRLLDAFTIGSVPLMAANTVRFFAWQNLLLLPLLLAAFMAVRRSKDLLQYAMFGAFVVTPAAMMILTAFQGHGWGYRYMHGLIGLVCIMAAAGWHWLRTQNRAPEKALMVATLATVCLSGPFLLWRAHEFAKPYAVADRFINAMQVDIAVVDDSASRYAIDLVLNRPDLINRPIRMVQSELDQSQLARLCQTHSIALVKNIATDRALVSEPLCGRDRISRPPASN